MRDLAFAISCILPNPDNQFVKSFPKTFADLSLSIAGKISLYKFT